MFAPGNHHVCAWKTPWLRVENTMFARAFCANPYLWFSKGLSRIPPQIPAFVIFAVARATL
jgi:hypothetical protein